MQYNFHEQLDIHFIIYGLLVIIIMRIPPRYTMNECHHTATHICSHLFALNFCRFNTCT